MKRVIILAAVLALASCAPTHSAKPSDVGASSIAAGYPVTIPRDCMYRPKHGLRGIPTRPYFLRATGEPMRVVADQKQCVIDGHAMLITVGEGFLAWYPARDLVARESVPRR